jgi:hypothetical protein
MQDASNSSMRRLTALAQEFGRRLDKAGVVPLSEADLPGVGVEVYLAIHDRPTTRQPRMYRVICLESDYRLLLDEVVKRQRNIQTRTSSQSA